MRCQTPCNHKEYFNHKKLINRSRHLEVKEPVSCVKNKISRILLLSVSDHWIQVALSKEEASTASRASLAWTPSSQIFPKCKLKIKRDWGSLLQLSSQRHLQRNLLKIRDRRPIWFSRQLRDSTTSSPSQRQTAETGSYQDRSLIFQTKVYGVPEVYFRKTIIRQVEGGPIGVPKNKLNQ